MSKKLTVYTYTEACEELLEGVKRIYEFQPMTNETWIKLYTLVFNYCSKAAHLVSSDIQTTSIKGRNSQFSAQIGGEDLYFSIKNYITNRLENICQNGTNLHGDAILRFYTDNWEEYTFPSKVTNGICLYLNQNWIRLSINAQRGDIYQVYSMAMKVWENVIFKSFHQQVTQTCLDLIRSERNNEVINTNLISKVIQSYVALGFIQNSANNNQTILPTLAIYKEFFEIQFLQDTEQFYRSESATFLVDNSVSEYLKKVARRLKEEAHRVQSYLHLSTLQTLITRVEEVLIRDHLEVIYRETKILLRDDKVQDLILLYELVSRVPNTVDRLKEIFKEHIYEMGMVAIERVSNIALNNPKVYIESILDIYTKYMKYVQDIFNRHNFIIVLDSACVRFINNNAMTQAAGNTRKSSELLARYSDIILRKGNKGVVEEAALEEKLNEIMSVFNYMEDKDVFLKFYGKMLAKRLVGNLSASDDYELSMISKLKEVCGCDYTLKLQRMFRDTSLSSALTDKYRTYCENRHCVDIDFSIMVLSCNSWPLSVQSNFILPIEIQRTMDNFTNFYSQQHCGRKLMWLNQHSRGDLQSLFTDRKYILQVSTYQMTVLLLFNKQTVWVVEQIQDETQIKLELLVQVLCSLLKAKLLICEKINILEEVKESDVKLDYRIELNKNFAHKNIRMNLNVPLKSVEQKDIEGVHRTIDEDRKLVIQAAIVRIMKARQTLKHALLMQEVIQQLASHFKPKIPLIKDCIGILIEKEYLERSADERDVLRYLA